MKKIDAEVLEDKQNIKVLSILFNFKCFLIYYGIATSLNNGVHQSFFLRVLLTDFRIGAYIKSGLSQRYFWRI